MNALSRTPLAQPSGETPPVAKPRRKKCVQCHVNWADYPSSRCPGCEAYSEHTR